MRQIGFIGMGSMASALLKGFQKTGAFPGASFAAYAPHQDRLRANAEKWGFAPYADVKALIAESDLCIMAVKASQVENVLAETAECFVDKALLSIVAGWDLARYQQLLPASARVQYVCPNTPAMVGAGAFMMEGVGTLTETELSEVTDALNTIGVVERIPPHLMEIADTVAGCTPAFFDMFMEAVADAGVYYGMPRDMAYRLISQSCYGSALLMKQSGEHPGALKDAVCSPGGDTILGVQALEESGFRNACYRAVMGAMKR